MISTRIIGTTALLALAGLALPLLLGQAATPANLPAPVRINPPEGVSAAPVVNHKKTDQMRGFSMQLVKTSPQEGIDHYLKAIDDIADMGCTWINLAVAAHQDNVHSEALGINWNNVPSPADILKIMARAKSRGMGIMLMPMVLLNNSGSKDWRGIIKPEDKEGEQHGWDNWFASYNKFIAEDMAAMATKGNVDIFCVGSELLSTEPFRDRWIATIANIRSKYKGKLTYSANWDHYEAVTFWDQLDYIGMNNYNELGNEKDTVTKLNGAWLPIKEKVLKFAAEKKKPFMFTEVGWHNLNNTLKEPWNYVAEGHIDLSEQLHAFQSFTETWQPVPKDQFMGFFIWEWCPLGHVTDRGTYSLQDTPALEVVKKWFAAP